MEASQVEDSHANSRGRSKVDVRSYFASLARQPHILAAGVSHTCSLGFVCI